VSLIVRKGAQIRTVSLLTKVSLYRREDEQSKKFESPLKVSVQVL